jgi:hypothetical protein
MLDRRADTPAGNLLQEIQPLGLHWSTPNHSPRLSKRKRIAAVIDAMRRLAEKDLARHDLVARKYCDACQRVRPGAGFVHYGRYAVCNACATEFEVANVRGLLTTIGRFVRDKNFGETAQYALDPALSG